MEIFCYCCWGWWCVGDDEDNGYDGDGDYDDEDEVEKERGMERKIIVFIRSIVY